MSNLITVDARKLAVLINRIQVWTEIKFTTSEPRKGQIVAQSAILEAEADLLDMGVQLPGGWTAEALRKRAAELDETVQVMTAKQGAPA